MPQEGRPQCDRDRDRDSWLQGFTHARGQSLDTGKPANDPRDSSHIAVTRRLNWFGSRYNLTARRTLNT